MSARCVLVYLAMSLVGWAESVEVGAARVDVTPTEPVVLAGYGGRTKPHEGVDTKLWARALVIGEKKPVAIVVLDNCGVPSGVKERLVKRLVESGITSERLMVAVTHTHNAPTLEGYATIVWAGRTTREQDEATARYTAFAIEKMAVAVESALAQREPMELEWGKGRATFGGNRRVLQSGEWRGFGHQRGGPVDHSLPLLVAKDLQGKVRVLWANYACHCTTVGGRNHVGGDWAGAANDAMERRYPKATALMTIGCGADVGPQPGGTLQIAAKHGEHIAAEVARMLAKDKLSKLSKPPMVTHQEIQLPLEEPKEREHWEQEVKRGGFHGELGKAMIRQLDTKGAIETEVAYPIHTWQFGPELAMVFLPGEVVVDYAVRLNRELDWRRLWITAWANDMPGYVPSRRILREGGYEADFSQVYYEKPGRYRPEVENLVVGTVRNLLGSEYFFRKGQKEAPFHASPSGEEEAFRRLKEWAQGPLSEAEQAVLKKVRSMIPVAQAGVARLIPAGAEETHWHNYAGDFVPRLFIRQSKRGTKLSWRSPAMEAGKGPVVLCFTGGLGWESEPQTEGFRLSVAGKERLIFDVTRKLSRWISDEGEVELVYLPLWTSTVDSGGFFFVRLQELPEGAEKGISLSVHSIGEGSKRWFAVDRVQKIRRTVKLLQAGLGAGE